MKNGKVYEALTKAIKAAGFTPLVSLAVVESKPHLQAWVEAERVYASSREIARGCYGHPAFEVEARLVDGAWVFWGGKSHGLPVVIA